MPQMPTTLTVLVEDRLQQSQASWGLVPAAPVPASCPECPARLLLKTDLGHSAATRRSPPASMEFPWLWCPLSRPVQGCWGSKFQAGYPPSAASPPSPFFLQADLAELHLVAHRDLAAFRQVHHRIEDDLIAWLDALLYFDFSAEITRDTDLLQMDDAILDDRDMLAIFIEY